MRTKEFIIFIVIYTIIYFTLSFIISFTINKTSDMKLEKKIKNKVNPNSYKKFALFYGIQSNISDQLLDSIYVCYSNIQVPCKISDYANKFGVTPYEFIVICLYLEYIGVCAKRIKSYERDLITNPNNIDRNIVNKYSLYFNERNNIDEISVKAGGNTYNDIYYLQVNNLMPGVKLLNNQVYYVGDIYEEN